MFVDEGEAVLKSLVFVDSSTFLLIFLFQELKIINQSIIINVEWMLNDVEWMNESRFSVLNFKKFFS